MFRKKIKKVYTVRAIVKIENVITTYVVLETEHNCYDQIDDIRQDVQAFFGEEYNVLITFEMRHVRV